MEQKEWLLTQIELLAKQDPKFETQAFYYELSKLVAEQYQRLAQGTGELDGRTWNHAEW